VRPDAERSVATLIVAYNSRATIERCVESVLGQQRDGDRIIVVDNASQDGTAAYVRERFSAVTVIEAPNRGYGAGTNLARRAATCDLLLVLNPDAHLESGSLDVLRGAADDGSILAPAQYDAGGRLTGVGYPVDLFGFYVPPEVCSKLFFAGGSSLLIPGALFDALDGFDEDGFLFGEDVDLSWRAWLYGYRVKAVPDAVVVHEHGHSIEGGKVYESNRSTSLRRRFWSERNTMRNMLSNYAWPALAVLFPLYGALLAAEIAILLAKRQFAAARTDVWAVVSFLRDVPATLRRRAVVQRRRRRDDRYVLDKMYWGSGKLVLFLRSGVPDYVE
jgi:GT2 family glycosyltransferase